jgi:putative ABC transport system permease protein
VASGFGRTLVGRETGVDVVFGSYLKLAWRVMWRRRFFTCISLFGIGLTLTVLILATAVLDHIFAPLAPEVRQDRTLLVIRARLLSDRGTRSSMPGYLLLDRYARNLPGVERMAVFAMPRTVYSYRGGQRIRSLIKRTDAEFWRVLDFRFLEGGPYTDQDVSNGAMVAVINATTRDRFFGGAPAVGRTLEADGLHFRVIGVVPDVPILRLVANGDIYAPVTTAKTDAYRSELMGGFGGLLLARSPTDFPAIQAEFESRLRAAPLPGRQWRVLYAPGESFFDYVAGQLLGARNEARAHPERLWALLAAAGLLFSLLPAVNLVNLNMSRIMERASEIGVRKAFGASSWTLVGQFVVENVVLTLVGGSAGLLLSALALGAVNASGLIPYAQFTVNVRVFAYGLALTTAFGVISGVYPAWRMSRLHPVRALKGASR